MTWLDSLPTDLMVEQNGQQVPIKDVPFIKESPDLGHFLLKAVETHREVGSRVPVKKVEKPEQAEAWRKDNLPKLYDAGLLDRPPASPEAYEIKKPEQLIDGLLWNDENAKKLGQVLHKYGVPKAAATELLTLHTEALVGAQAALKADYDSGIASLKQEFGGDYDRLVEQSKRLTAHIFKSPEEVEFFEKTQMGNHPAFLAVMMRLSKFAEQDSSLLPEMRRSEGGVTPEQAQAELAAISSDPNHPKYKLYWAKDAATMQYIDDLYKKAYGTGTVTVG